MPKNGTLLLARVADGVDLALDAAAAEAGRDQDAVHARRAAAAAPRFSISSESMWCRLTRQSLPMPP